MPDSPATLPAAYVGLVDDAAIFPPGNSSLDDAVRAWQERTPEPWSALVGTFVVSDHTLAELADLASSHRQELPVSVVVTTGAGGIAPAASTANRLDGIRLAGLEVALRDAEDLEGNARRVAVAVEQARDHGAIEDEVPVYVELPQAEPSHGWLTAADEVAAREDLGLRLKFRTGGVASDQFPSVETLAAWIVAALDRETPFKCTAGLHHALRHTDPASGITHHGFLNVLAATRTALDGGDIAAVLAEQDADAIVAALPDPDTLARTRRWFASFGSCSVREPLDDLVALGLVERAVVEPFETVETEEAR